MQQRSEVIQTLVFTKQRGRWRISAFQNTDSPDRKRDVAIRLEEFAGEAKYLSQHLMASIETKLAPAGLTASEIETRTKRVIEAWLAA